MLKGTLLGQKSLSGSIGRQVIQTGGGGGITEEELNEALATKVDKIVTDSGFEFAYTHQNGAELKKVVSSSYGSAYIPIRRGDSKNFDIGTPLRDEECSNKKYVDDRFSGASKPITFDTYLEMITALNGMTATDIKRGQDIFIVQTGIPDVWVAYISETSVPYTYVDDDTFVNELLASGTVQVGYYKLGYLETQKVDLTEYVKNTDYATSDIAGVVKIQANTGVEMRGQGAITVASATELGIDNRAINYSGGYGAITPKNLDYAVKVGMTTNKEDWTDEEKASASNLIGAVKQVEYSTGQTFADGSDGGVIGRAYMRFRDNTENSIVLNCQNVKYTIPVRDSAGNFYVGNPTQSYHTVTKKYLEDNYTNEVASSPYNNSTGKYDGTAGLFMFDGGGKGGFFKSTTSGDGADRFRIKKASYTDIDNRTPSTYHDAGVVGANHCCPITPANLDHAVIEVLTNSKIDLTEEQVSAIQNWLGLGDINTALEGILGV